MSGTNTHIPTTSITMSSREIADLCGKRHDHVMRDIAKMLAAIGLPAPNFGGTFRVTQPRGGFRDVPCYHLPRDLTLTLITGYRADLRYKVVRRLEALEAERQRLVAVKAHTRRLPPRPATLPTPESGPAKGEIMAAQKRRELIREHTTKLLALVAAEAPAEATRVSLHLWSDWGPDPDANTHCGISANATRREWKADQRMPEGGLFTDKDVAHWLPGKGNA